jgi:hypothetical protein
MTNPHVTFQGDEKCGLGVLVTLDDVSVEITAQLQTEVTYACPFCVHLYSTGNVVTSMVFFLIYSDHKRNNKIQLLVKNE